MKRVTVIYDDRMMPGRDIRAITGDKSFGETILKRVPLKDRIKESSLACKNTRDFIIISHGEGNEKLNQLLINDIYRENTAFLYMYSNFAIRNETEFSYLIQKAVYADRVYAAYCSDRPAALLIPDKATLMQLSDDLASGQASGEKIDQAAFSDLSLQPEFLSYITGGFDARFFNALEGDDYSVTKRSSKKEKIKAEYEFYSLLPDDMKQWFVMPYGYSEDKKGASYTMERIHTTDIAIRYVHGAVSADELSDILDRLFYFLDKRAVKNAGKDAASGVAEKAYIEKVRTRIDELRKDKRFADFDQMIKAGTGYDGIDSVIEHYEKLYRELRKTAYGKKGHRYNGSELAISHGDLCFYNILYSREAGLLKLIDPKGASDKEDLYMDPYYDIAKLSHSVCGGYDFFNSGLYQVSLTRDMKWNLTIDADLSAYEDVFKGFLEKNGYDHSYVRICEAGLFLSMLPLHMDQPGKVFGFLLNAIGIMERLEADKKQ